MAWTSDDFSAGSINSFWTQEDPSANCTFSQSGGVLSIAMSASQSHDYYSGGVHNSPRLTQALTDDQFRVTAKFNSTVNAAYKNQGLIFFQDDNNVVRCDSHHDGFNQYIFASTSAADTWTDRFNTVLANPPLNPFYVRVTRAGTSWTYEYGSDGVNWTTAGTFTKSLTMAKAGIVAGNADPGTGAPAFTLQADFFVVDYPAKPQVYSSAISRAAWY